ncbi:hypothetical protein BaRGS_00028547 [Batillaria attramentaria]|uniref:Uncharacterized protein n=1 Tax=Batillaria attramentaria TaxID=370345 RepID=A0ABD0JZ15_9CAEN
MADRAQRGDGHSENSDNPGVTVCDASSLSSQASTYTTNIRDDDAPSNARSRRAEFAGQRLPTANSEDSGRGTSLSSYATSSLEEETDRNSPDPRQGLEPARESRRDCQRVRGQARLHTPTPPPQAAGDGMCGH